MYWYVELSFHTQKTFGPCQECGPPYIVPCPLSSFSYFYLSQTLEKHVVTFCEHLSVSTLVNYILNMFIDLATANPIVFVDHVTQLKQFSEQQPIYTQQVVQIVGAVGTVSKVCFVCLFVYCLDKIGNIVRKGKKIKIMVFHV